MLKDVSGVFISERILSAVLTSLEAVFRMFGEETKFWDERN